MENGLIIGLSFGLAATATIIIVLATLVAVKRYKSHKKDDVFWFANALWLGWIGTLFFRTAYIAGDYDWIKNTFLARPDFHWTVNLFLATTIVSGLLHIRALTWRSNSLQWQWMAALVSAVILFTWWLAA